MSISIDGRPVHVTVPVDRVIRSTDLPAYGENGLMSAIIAAVFERRRRLSKYSNDVDVREIQLTDDQYHQLCREVEPWMIKATGIGEALMGLPLVRIGRPSHD